MNGPMFTMNRPISAIPQNCLTNFGEIKTKLYPALGTSLVAGLIVDIYAFN